MSAFNISTNSITVNNSTNILGYLKINSDSGTAGQVLTSNGNNTVPTWTSLSSVGFGWVGSATSNLSMGIYSIIGSTLDSSNTTLTIGGTTATSVTIGKALNTTNILGNLQIGGSAGTTGQVLTSNNVSTVWSNPSWVGTATSNLSMGSNSIICNNIDASATTLTIGGVTAQGVTLGKALTATNILGNLNIAGTAGSSGQVLRSNGTTAVWDDNWTPTATSGLNMGAFAITGTSLDSTTTLALGTGTATSINIGRTGIAVNMSVLNVSSITTPSIDTTGILSIGTTNATPINIGKTGVAVNMSVLNVSTITTPSIDTTGILNIGTTNATPINIGKTGVAVNMSVLNVSTITTPSIDTTGILSIGTTSATPINIGKTGVAVNMSVLNVSTITTPSIDTTGRLSIGTTNATPINIGKTGVAVNMSVLNVSTITTPSIDTTGILSIGTTNATPINIGRTGISVNMSVLNTSSITTPSIDTTGILNIGTTSATPINIGRTGIAVNMSVLNVSTITTPSIDTTGILSIGTTNATPINIGKTGVAVNMSVLNVSSITTPSIDTTGILSIGTTSATPINIGRSGVSVNMSVFNTSSITTPSIGSSGSTLLVTQPIQPSGLTYSGTTGTTTGAIGQRISLSLTAMDVTTNALQVLTGLNISLTAGVWYVQCKLVYLNQNASNITFSRVIGNIGSGTSTNLLDDIASYTDTDVLLKTTAATGQQKITTFGGIFATNSTTFAAISVQVNDATSPLPMRFAAGTTLTAVRLA